MSVNEEAITKILKLYIALYVFVSHTKTNICHITPPQNTPTAFAHFYGPDVDHKHA